MVATPATDSPDASVSGGGTPHAKPSSLKDRTCKFCGQAFTSSSLGRHLDQFISKKKPDGVHNVDEIKRMRAGITRRQARNSQARQPTEDTELEDQQPSQSTRKGPTLEIPFEDKRPKELKVLLNAMTWQNTGVINDIPSTDSPAPVAIPTTVPRRSTINLESPMRSDTPDKDTIRALELALREVLDTVQAASARTRLLPSPFDFDFQAQSYPSLCLLLLPIAPSLFSSQVFSTPDTVPIEPPGMDNIHPLKAKIKEVIDRWQVTHMPQNEASTEESSSDIAQDVSKQHMDMAKQHLQIVYQKWIIQPIEVKREQWRLELLKAFAQETTRRKETEERLHRVEQESRRLEAQVEFLSKCQWPREFALFPPERRTFSKEASNILQEVSTAGIGQDASLESYWDYDNLVQKWKRVVTEDAARRLGMAASARIPTDSASTRPSLAASPRGTPRLAQRESPSSIQQDRGPPRKRSRRANGGVNDGHGQPDLDINFGRQQGSISDPVARRSDSQAPQSAQGQRAATSGREDNRGRDAR